MQNLKLMIILMALMALSACIEVTVKTTDPDTGVLNDVTVKGVRKVAVSTNVKGTTVIAGEVAINNETAQVLAKEAAPIIKDKP